MCTPIARSHSHTCRRQGMNIYALVHPYEEVTMKTEELVLMEDLDERIWRKGELPSCVDEGGVR